MAVIQAREGSSRLPRKASIELAERPVLEHVIRAVRASGVFDRTVVATTDRLKDDRLEEIAREEGVNAFRGDEKDVLSRFVKVAREYGARILGRFTADNPLIDPEVIRQVADAHDSEKHDHTSNKTEPKTWPGGMDMEIVNADAIEWAWASSPDEEEKEHVTLYLRTRPEEFRLNSVWNQNKKTRRPEFRLTLDTEVDLQVLQRIFQDLYEGEPLPLGEVIVYLDQNPDLAKLNQHIGQTSVKGKQ